MGNWVIAHLYTILKRLNQQINFHQTLSELHFSFLMCHKSTIGRKKREDPEKFDGEILKWLFQWPHSCGTMPCRWSEAYMIGSRILTGESTLDSINPTWNQARHWSIGFTLMELLYIQRSIWDWLITANGSLVFSEILVTLIYFTLSQILKTFHKVWLVLFSPTTLRGCYGFY